jgi:hypothetical protein
VIIARSFGNIFNDVLYLTNMVIIVGHRGSYSADRNIRPQADRNGRQKKLTILSISHPLRAQTRQTEKERADAKPTRQCTI